MTATPPGSLPAAGRREAAREADELLAWLHPDARRPTVSWAPA